MSEVIYHHKKDTSLADYIWVQELVQLPIRGIIGHM
jgi:hypothetical protein